MKDRPILCSDKLVDERILTKRFSKTCFICNKGGDVTVGSCINCLESCGLKSSCKLAFHPMCALENGYTFKEKSVYNVEPVCKASRRILIIEDPNQSPSKSKERSNMLPSSASKLEHVKLSCTKKRNRSTSNSTTRELGSIKDKSSKPGKENKNSNDTPTTTRSGKVFNSSKT